MSNDNKTLADVQPGGRVRLGDQAERARFEAWAQSKMNISRWKDGKYMSRYVQEKWEIWQAAISAQPSPGGQDALDCIGRIEEAIEFRVPHDIYAAVHGELAELKAALAARQPVYEGHTWISDYVLAGLRERAALPLQLRNGEVWHWQGDGHDFPESLACPVIMSAETLRALLAARQPVGEPVIDYEDLVDQAKDLIQCGCSVNGAFDWLLEQLTDGEVLASPAQAVDLAPASIPNTPEVRDILGRPNFWCSPWANVLRMRGDEIPNKAEEEQAAVIRFMLNHYLANGTAWAETAGAELDAIRKVDGKAVGNG